MRHQGLLLSHLRSSPSPLHPTHPPVLALWHFLVPLAPRCLASQLHLYQAAFLLLGNQSATFRRPVQGGPQVLDCTDLQRAAGPGEGPVEPAIASALSGRRGSPLPFGRESGGIPGLCPPAPNGACTPMFLSPLVLLHTGPGKPSGPWGWLQGWGFLVHPGTGVLKGWCSLCLLRGNHPPLLLSTPAHPGFNHPRPPFGPPGKPGPGCAGI